MLGDGKDKGGDGWGNLFKPLQTTRKFSMKVWYFIKKMKHPSIELKIFGPVFRFFFWKKIFFLQKIPIEIILPDLRNHYSPLVISGVIPKQALISFHLAIPRSRKTP
jgi:hypothetical protein